MKTKIIKDRSGRGVYDDNWYFPDRLSGHLGDIYRMSYIEIVEAREILFKEVDNREDFLLSILNKKIYVVNSLGPGPYRGPILNIFIKENFEDFYEKYKLLFD